MTRLDAETKRHLRSLLLVLTAAVCFGFAVVAGLVYYYGPDGSYRVRQVLLEPQVLEGLNYADRHPMTGRRARLLFDSVEYTYTDQGSGKRRARPVDLSVYGRFYQTISGERSVLKNLQGVEDLFHKGNVTTLSLRVRVSGESGSYPFQEVDFLEGGDYYRVQLREDSPHTTWAYFHHPKIFYAATKLFVK